MMMRMNMSKIEAALLICKIGLMVEEAEEEETVVVEIFW
jgi:hypothetical protein